MKKILTSLALLGVVTTGAYAQRECDIETVYIAPIGGEESPFSINCTDSFGYEYLFINHGPDALQSGDTLYYYSPWVADGYVNYIAIDATVNSGDTVVHYGGNTHFDELERLWDVSSGEPVYKPFANGDYYFAILFAGFSDTTVVNDHNDENREGGTAFTIDCPVSILDIHTKEALSIFPNPATSTINVNYNFSANTPAAIRVTDVTGRVVLNKDLGNQTPGAQQFSVDVSTLNSGIYTIELITDQQRAISKLTISK